MSFMVHVSSGGKIVDEPGFGRGALSRKCWDRDNLTQCWERWDLLGSPCRDAPLRRGLRVGVHPYVGMATQKVGMATQNVGMATQNLMGG